ncbi:MFS transporter [Gracilibacillus oryzae]|uniref:MFS transporter n=1 Tax=Gracilibacillus oryzae TaxID=1672701 RepID=A0A7C8GRK9_9BACI|nr:MFS transporter [Gracilibacillus oryzae]KAB8126986.1 MFS transporter [Gracilibacillus oryzae]
MGKLNSEHIVFPIAKEKTIAPVFILFAVCPGAFLSHFSAGLVNIALPQMSLFFQTSLSITQWVVTAYLLAVMISLPLMGKLADLFGMKEIHNIGYIVFGIGALLSAASHSLIFLIAARIIQGVGAAMLQSTNMAIIAANYPGENRGRAMGIVGTAVGLGALLGPSIGGFLINIFSWEILFWLQVPIVMIVSIFSFRFIPQNNSGRKHTPFDYTGAAMFAFGITAVIYVLNVIGDNGFTFYLIPVSFAGVLSIWLFVRRSYRLEYPFIQLSLFKPPLIKIGGMTIIVSYMITFSTMVVIPFYLVGVLETTTSFAGILLMAYPLLMAITGPISGNLADVFGSKKVVIIGLVVMLFSLAGLGLITPGTNTWKIAALLCLLGLAMGVLTSPNYTLMIGQVSKELLGTISSAIALLRNLGMALGTAFGVTFMNLWVEGSITEWMSNGNHENLDQVMLGFQSFFWFLLLLNVIILLIGIKIFKNN